MKTLAALLVLVLSQTASADLTNDKYGLVSYSEEVLEYLNMGGGCGLQAMDDAVGAIIDQAQEDGVDYPDIHISKITQTKSEKIKVQTTVGEMNIKIVPFSVVANGDTYNVNVACGSGSVEKVSK